MFSLRGALFIVIAQTCINNALRHRLTARTTGGVFLVFILNGQFGMTGDRKSAMEAVFFVHGGGFYAQMQAKEKVSGVMKKNRLRINTGGGVNQWFKPIQQAIRLRLMD